MSTLGRARSPAHPILLGTLGKSAAPCYPMENGRDRPRGGRSGHLRCHWVIGYAKPACSSRPPCARSLGTLGKSSGRFTHAFTHGKSSISKGLFSLWVCWVQIVYTLFNALENALTRRRGKTTSRTIERELPSQNRTQLPNGIPSRSVACSCRWVTSRERLPNCA